MESTLGIVLRPPPPPMPIVSRPPPRSEESLDSFQRYMLNVIRELKNIYRDTYGYEPRKLLLGDFLQERLRALYDDYQWVREYYMPEEFPWTSVYASMGENPTVRQPKERDVMRPVIEDLWVMDYPEDEFHLEVI